MIKQADKNYHKAKQILELYEKERNRIIDLNHSQFAISTLDFLFNHTIFSVSDFYANSGIPVASARKMLKKLRDNNYFETLQENRGRQPAILIFTDLFNIAESG